MKKIVSLLLTIILIVSWSIFAMIAHTTKEGKMVSSVISPRHDYIDYDPMKDCSDSLAMYLQELRYNKL